MTVKQLAWSVRSDAGSERLMIADALAGGGKASDEWQRKTTELRQRVSTIWATLLNFVDDPQTPQALRDSIAEAKEAYFAHYIRYRDEVYKSLNAGDRPRPTSRAWIQESNPALESLIGRWRIPLLTWHRQLRIECRPTHYDISGIKVCWPSPPL
jgi:hypothetical protein